MKRRLTYMLCILLVISLFTGCGAKKSDASAPDESTINGVALAEYTLVYSQDAPDYCQRAAQYIQTQVKVRTGVELAVRQASEGSFPHEIVVGETDRPISQQLNAKTENVEFAILADENHIALEGDFFIIAAAAYYFVETYIPGGHFDSAVPQQVTIHQPITQEAKIFIFLIGDGMGYTQTQLFDNLEVPQNAKETDGERIFYGYYLPYQGSIHTDSLSGVTDSAAAGTALATGHKTINHYVGKDADGNDLQSLTELAISMGMGTAVMSTDQMNGATPATFSTHALDRDDTDTLMVGIQEKMLGGTLIRCGLHSDSSYQQKITDTLTQLSANDKGFFLMYEEGHIDKFSHNWNLEDTYCMMYRFNQAIGLFMEFAFYHPDTFLIITADHETGGLTINDQGYPEYTVDGHTGADVPIFGYGQGAEVFQNYDEENNKVPQVIAALWGVSEFGQP